MFSWNQTTLLGTGSLSVNHENMEAWYSCETPSTDTSTCIPHAKPDATNYNVNTNNSHSIARKPCDWLGLGPLLM